MSGVVVFSGVLGFVEVSIAACVFIECQHITRTHKHTNVLDACAARKPECYHVLVAVVVVDVLRVYVNVFGVCLFCVVCVFLGVFT